MPSRSQLFQSSWLGVQDICLCIVENGQSFHALHAKLCVVFDQSTHTVQLYYGQSLEVAVEAFAEGWLHFVQALKTERLPVGEVSRLSKADKMRFSQLMRRNQ